MKSFAVALLVACFVACAHSFPGVTDESSEKGKDIDTVLVLPSEFKERLAFSLGEPDSSFDDSNESSLWNWPTLFRSNVLDGWYSSVQAQMKRLRDQMADILSHISEQGDVSWSKIPEGANTTSVTKVIDGHLVTINETTYMDSGDEHSTLIRVRVIDVKPENDTILTTESEADTEVTSLPTVAVTGTTTTKEDRTMPLRSVETVEDFDNEIPKNQVDTLTA